jgi:hypothetical protein
MPGHWRGMVEKLTATAIGKYQPDGVMKQLLVLLSTRFPQFNEKAGSEVRSWSSEGVRLCSCKVFLGSRKSLRSSSPSARSTADRCLLKGTNPSPLLRKGCASRFLSIATAASGLNHFKISMGGLYVKP